MCDPGESEWEAKAWKSPKTSYSSNIHGCLKAWSESRGKHLIKLDGEDRDDVRQGQLIITPDGTAKGEDILYSILDKKGVGPGML